MSEVNMSYVKTLENKIKSLEKEYGQGVRPSWVSEEISWLRRCKKEAEGKYQSFEE